MRPSWLGGRLGLGVTCTPILRSFAFYRAYELDALFYHLARIEKCQTHSRVNGNDHPDDHPGHTPGDLASQIKV